MSRGRAVHVGTASDLAAALAAACRGGTFAPAGWDGDIFRADLTGLVAN
jgi:hypothetical protein